MPTRLPLLRRRAYFGQPLNPQLPGMKYCRLAAGFLRLVDPQYGYCVLSIQNFCLVDGGLRLPVAFGSL